MEFNEIVEKRYAAKKFTGEEVSAENIAKLKKIIQYAASSYGLQPYTIHVITKQDIKDKLQEASWNQPQVGTASHVFVFCAFTDVKSRIDQYEQFMKDASAPEESIKMYIGMMRSLEEKSRDDIIAWGKNQAYIALGNGLNGATSLGFDSCPMEGFDPKAYSEILNLPENEVPVVVMPVGIAADTPRPKIRYPQEDLFHEGTH